MSPAAVLTLAVVAVVVVLAVVGVLHAVLAGRGRRRRDLDSGASLTGRAVLDDIARSRRRGGGNGDA